MVAMMIIPHLFPGIMRVDGFAAALVASFILGIINAVIRPILIFLRDTALTVVTFGFFLLILNGLLLGLVSFIVPGFYISGLGGGHFRVDSHQPCELGSIGLTDAASGVLTQYSPYQRGLYV